MERKELVERYWSVQILPMSSERHHQINQLNRETAEYLCSTPQDKKYRNLIMSDLFLRSARYRHGFCGKKAGSLMQRLEKLALNPILYPWRSQEHALIYKWYPFYQTELVNCLDGAGDLMTLIGYTETSEGFRLDSRITSSTAQLQIAFDFFTAKIECEILTDIKRIASRRIPSISWLEIVEARQRTRGDVEVCATSAEQLNNVPSAVRWSLDEEAKPLKSSSALDDEEKRELHKLLEDFDAVEDFEARFGPSAGSTGSYKTETNSAFDTSSFRPFSESNLLSFQRCTEGALESAVPQPHFHKSASRVPRWTTHQANECPKCRMLNPGSAILCGYCNFLFTNGQRL